MNSMKDPNPVSSEELRRNLISGGIAGAELGLAFGIGFEQMLLGLVIGIFLGAAVGYRIARIRTPMRYPMRVIRWMFLAVGFSILTTFVYIAIRERPTDLFQSRWMVILPIAGWSSLIISIGAAIASLDEMQRRIMTEAIAIAFGGTAIAVLAYSLLQFEGTALINLGAVLLVMVVMLLVGKAWTMWKYR